MLVATNTASARRSPVRRAAGRTGLVLLWVGCALFLIAVVYQFKDKHQFGLDSHAYWLTGHRGHLYVLPPGKDDAYLYSPAFATAIWPLAQLPWHVFMVLWGAVEFAAFAWMLAPLPIRWMVPLLMVCAGEALAGDIYGLLGLAALYGLTRPGLWALPALTKIAPALGIPWFAIRREWRALAIALGTTALIIAISVAITPHAWSQWFHFLVHNRGRSTVLYPVRLPIAAAVLVYAARTDRKWLLPVAMMLAMPMAANPWTLTMLAPVPRLAGMTARETYARAT